MNRKKQFAAKKMIWHGKAKAKYKNKKNYYPIAHDTKGWYALLRLPNIVLGD